MAQQWNSPITLESYILQCSQRLLLQRDPTTGAVSPLPVHVRRSIRVGIQCESVGGLLEPRTPGRKKPDGQQFNVVALPPADDAAGRATDPAVKEVPPESHRATPWVPPACHSSNRRLFA